METRVPVIRNMDTSFRWIQSEELVSECGHLTVFRKRKTNGELCLLGDGTWTSLTAKTEPRADSRPTRPHAVKPGLTQGLRRVEIFGAPAMVHAPT